MSDPLADTTARLQRLLEVVMQEEIRQSATNSLRKSGES
jgi:hypothetical protein